MHTTSTCISESKLCASNSMDNSRSAKPKVLIHQMENVDYSMFHRYFDLVSISRLEQEPSLKYDIEGAVTYAGQAHNVMAPSIASLTNLKALTSAGAGKDHLVEQLEDYKKRGIKVGYSPDALSTPTADFTFTLLLATARNIREALHTAINSSKIDKYVENARQGIRVGDASIGIIGMGRIGYKVAQRARGFNMTVLYHNRNRRGEAEEMTVKATHYSDLKEMVPLCDFLVVCCPLTSQTRRMINHDVFRVMKPSAILVNTSRGAVVDTDALVEAVSSGRIRGAALDVTDPEPLPADHPLLQMDNVLVTAHRGWADNLSLDDVLQDCCANLKAVLIDNQDIPTSKKLC